MTAELCPPVRRGFVPVSPGWRWEVCRGGFWFFVGACLWSSSVLASVFVSLLGLLSGSLVSRVSLPLFRPSVRWCPLVPAAVFSAAAGGLGGEYPPFLRGPPAKDKDKKYRNPLSATRAFGFLCLRRRNPVRSGQPSPIGPPDRTGPGEGFRAAAWMKPNFFFSEITPLPARKYGCGPEIAEIIPEITSPGDENPDYRTARRRLDRGSRRRRCGVDLRSTPRSPPVHRVTTLFPTPTGNAPNALSSVYI